MWVYVQDQTGKPLMPTQRGGAVRRWLQSGRARVIRREPFTIRLLERAGGYTQPLQAGVDLGSAHVGVSIVSETQEVFAAEFKLRTDVSGLLTERRRYRRSRRGRKTRHRAPRFLNRKHRDELAPSVRAKVEQTLRIVRLMASLLPITSWTFEIATFDIHKLVNAAVEGTGYQQGEQYGFENGREYVLWRDRHTCQNPTCDRADPVLTVHHLRQRADGGSDRPTNLVTLCKTCHWRHHHERPLDLPAPSAPLRDASQLNVVKAYVMRAVNDLQPVVTFGYITKAKRIVLSLPKSHRHDAFVIAGGARQTRLPVTYHGAFFRRQNRKLFKGSRSHLRNTIPSAQGFRRGDRVRMSDGQAGFVFGLRSSGYFDVRRLDGTVLHHSTGYKTLQRTQLTSTLRIERRAGLKLERRMALPPAAEAAGVRANHA